MTHHPRLLILGWLFPQRWRDGLRGAALVATVLVAGGCGTDPILTGDPAVRYRGVVSLPAGTALSGGGQLVLSFGEGDGTGKTDLGDSTHVFDWDGERYDVLPGDFPYAFDFSDMGVPFTGGGIAVLDLDGDRAFSTGDRYSSVLTILESQFETATLNVSFVLDQVVP